jgi:hypothetical protein
MRRAAADRTHGRGARTSSLACHARALPLRGPRAAAACLPGCRRASHAAAPPQDVVFPAFDEVKAEHVVPGMRALLSELQAEIDRLEGSVEPTWEGLVQPLERISDRHQRIWGIVSHLKARGRPGCFRGRAVPAQLFPPALQGDGACQLAWALGPPTRSCSWRANRG